MRFKTLVFVVIIAVLLILTLKAASLNPQILDDVTPAKECNDLIDKSDILFVIPNYENNSLDLYASWCQEMRSLNKTFGLHGLTHSYHELGLLVNDSKLKKGAELFENCFGYKPQLFRPPYNYISAENEVKVTAMNMTIYKTRYFLHPYCHCQPRGLMKLLNWLISC